MSVHDVAAAGFGSEADAYERARPTYPSDAVRWLSAALALVPGAMVADVAAGTGKLTRLLVASGATVLAVEPVGGMRAQLLGAVPGVPALGAVAEALPFRSGSLDAITVAQAIHWFDRGPALAELHRVLRPDGRLGVIGNHRDRSVAWVNTVWTLVDEIERDAPWRGHEKSQVDTFRDQPWFTPATTAMFPNEQRLTPEQVVDRIRSISHVAALAPRAQSALLDEIRHVLATDPTTAGAAALTLPYQTDVCWSTRT
jgi:ubiquinone/menaquinone biosynthesis C-methylase UbiE